eukprot:2570893-Pyramimonas_sp.AAC.3
MSCLRCMRDDTVDQRASKSVARAPESRGKPFVDLASSIKEVEGVGCLPCHRSGHGVCRVNASYLVAVLRTRSEVGSAASGAAIHGMCILLVCDPMAMRRPSGRNILQEVNTSPCRIPCTVATTCVAMTPFTPPATAWW